MRPEPLRRLSVFAAAAVAALIVVLTLFVSPAEGAPLSRLVPEGFGPSRAEAADICLAGIQCQDGHALAFFALGLFAALHVAASWPPSERLRPLTRLLAALIAFAALDEVAQGWAGRDPSFADWLADASGIFWGVLLGSQFTRVLLRQ